MPGKKNARRKKRMTKIISKIKQIDENKGSETDKLNELTRLMEQSNAIAKEGDTRDRFTNASELVLNSELLRASSKFLNIGDDDDDIYSAESIAESFLKIVRCDDGKLDWSKLEEPVLAQVTAFRPHRSMLGAIQPNVQLPKPKQRSTRTTKQVGAENKPTNVVGPSQNMDGITRLNKVFGEIKEILEKRPDRCVPYWALITHPTSLWHTIDNALQVSHITRDGLVRFEVDDEGEKFICLTENAKEGENRQHRKDVEMEAFIVSVDLAIQEANVKRYRITEPMMKHNLEEDD